MQFYQPLSEQIINPVVVIVAVKLVVMKIYSTRVGPKTMAKLATAMRFTSLKPVTWRRRGRSCYYNYYFLSYFLFFFF